MVNTLPVQVETLSQDPAEPRQVSSRQRTCFSYKSTQLAYGLTLVNQLTGKPGCHPSHVWQSCQAVTAHRQSIIQTELAWQSSVHRREVNMTTSQINDI